MILRDSFITLMTCFVLLIFCNPHTAPKKLDTTSALEVVEYQGSDEVGQVTNYLHQESSIPKTALVYFYDDLSGSCQKFKQALPHAKMAGALQGVRMLNVNVSNYKQLASHFGVNSVPALVKVDIQGQPLAKITNAEWHEDMPEAMAPVLAKLTGSRTYDIQ